MVHNQTMPDRNATYQIRIGGVLRGKWRQWLDGVEIIDIQESSSDTTICVTVPDQAALRGLLNRLWDLNLIVISVLTPEKRIRIGGKNDC